MALKRRTRILILLGLLLGMAVACAASFLGMFQVPWLEDIEPSDAPGNGRAWRDSVVLDGELGREVDFVAYAPRPRKGERFPVLVYVGGYNIRPKWITRGGWAAFADRHRFAVVGPFFFGRLLEIMDDVSYHFPKAWSGRALDEILARVARDTPIQRDRIYLFGFSAGAQFAHRYALLRPRRVRAVAAHAAGQYTRPTRYVPARFLITVGSEDASRVGPAKTFVRSAKRLDIRARLLRIKGHDHSICQQQLDRSRRFFLEVRENR